MQSSLIPVDSALEQMLEMATKPPRVESVALTQAAGRVLAEDLFSSINVPPADNSSMDGYALRYSDRLAPLPVSQRVAAGHPPKPLKPGTCARIFTGGEIPEGADLVVMQEAVSMTAFDDILVPDSIKQGQNIRPAGQDIRKGDLIISAGTRLDYRHLALIASIGVPMIKVYCPVKVAILSTGDELVMPGNCLAPGQIYNSNRYLLQGFIESLQAEMVSFVQVSDSYDDTLSALKTASEQADLILSTGGVSVGEEDHVKPAVEALGQLSLWRLAMKPGKPLAFGKIDQALFLGLPGNPVSSFVGAHIFVAPLLAKLSGLQRSSTEKLTGVVNFSASTQVRQEYLRVRAVWKDDQWHLDLHPNQNSGVLSSVVKCNALAIMPPRTEVSPGDHLDFWLY